MRIVVTDTETTGIDPAIDRVVELAFVELFQDDEWRRGTSCSTLVNPDRPIPPQASAVHHLVTADVAGAPGLDDAILATFPLAEPDHVTTIGSYVMAAHNAAFDRGFLPQFNHVPWLCTYRCALHLFPEAPGYSNQVLRYWLGLPGPTSTMPPHRALPDAEVTSQLLQQMLKSHTLDKLLEMQSKPVLLKQCKFGKHAGIAWKDLPLDYLAWIVRKGGFDVDVMYTAQYYLGNIS